MGRIVRAPFVAGLAISLADPGGPIEATKETLATLKSATNPPSREQLLADVALEIQAMTQQKQNPLKGYKPSKDALPGPQILDELRRRAGHRRGQGDRRRGGSVRRWLVATAQDAANAAKDGGFMGFGAHQVSQGEQAMLDQVSAAVTR